MRDRSEPEDPLNNFRPEDGPQNSPEAGTVQALLDNFGPPPQEVAMVWALSLMDFERTTDPASLPKVLSWEDFIVAEDGNLQFNGESREAEKQAEDGSIFRQAIESLLKSSRSKEIGGEDILNSLKENAWRKHPLATIYRDIARWSFAQGWSQLALNMVQRESQSSQAEPEVFRPTFSSRTPAPIAPRVKPRSRREKDLAILRNALGLFLIVGFVGAGVILALPPKKPPTIAELTEQFKKEQEKETRESDGLNKPSNRSPGDLEFEIDKDKSEQLDNDIVLQWLAPDLAASNADLDLGKETVDSSIAAKDPLDRSTPLSDRDDSKPSDKPKSGSSASASPRKDSDEEISADTRNEIQKGLDVALIEALPQDPPESIVEGGAIRFDYKETVWKSAWRLPAKVRPKQPQWKLRLKGPRGFTSTHPLEIELNERSFHRWILREETEFPCITVDVLANPHFRPSLAISVSIWISPNQLPLQISEQRLAMFDQQLAGLKVELDRRLSNVRERYNAVEGMEKTMLRAEREQLLQARKELETTLLDWPEAVRLANRFRSEASLDAMLVDQVLPASATSPADGHDTPEKHSEERPAKMAPTPMPVITLGYQD